MAAFWVVLLLGVGAGAGVLHWLGPPAPELAEAPAPSPAAEPAAPVPPAPPMATPDPAQASPGQPAASPARPVPAQPGPAQPVPAPAAPAAAPMPPPAPEPPPLSAPPPRRAAADPVIPPPDPLLLEPSRHGLVPRRAPDGRTAIRTYARPFDREGDRRPRIGLIIGNMGAFAQHSEDAIRRLPGGITLAFSPYATRPEPLLERARARGMEVLTALPLEPAGYGQDADPGDRALLTSLSVAENLDRLDWALSRMQGQVGAIGALSRMRGERFAQNGELLGAVQAALAERGLLYVEPRPGGPQPARAFGRSVDILLDEPSETRGEIERRLAELEALARQANPPSALGMIGNPTPAAIAAIQAWSAGLEDRGAVIAPVTVLLRRPADQAGR